MGLALADIAGKGISATLLMANLQAHLRSQYAAGSLLRAIATTVLQFSSGERDDDVTLVGLPRALRFPYCGLCGT